MGDYRRDQRRGQIGSRTPTQDHQEAPGARCFCQADHPIRHPQEGRPTETDVAIVSLMRIEAEVPHQEVGVELLHARADFPLQERKVRAIHAPATSRLGKRQVHLRAIRRLEVCATNAQVEDGWIVPHEITGSISVMRVGIHDGDSPERRRSPHLRHRDHDVVEAAIPAEEAPTRVMAAGPDEAECIAERAGGDLRHTRHHTSHGGARCGSEGVGLNLGNQGRIVHAKDLLIRGEGALDEPNLGVL